MPAVDRIERQKKGESNRFVAETCWTSLLHSISCRSIANSHIQYFLHYYSFILLLLSSDQYLQKRNGVNHIQWMERNTKQTKITGENRKWAKGFIISIILIETNSEKQKKETTKQHQWHWNHIHSQTAVGIYSISLNCWFNSSSFWVCIMKIYHQRMKNENSATNEKFNSEFRI